MATSPLKCMPKDPAPAGSGHEGSAQAFRHAEPLTVSRSEKMLLHSFRHPGLFRAGARFPAGRRIPAPGPVLRPSPQRVLENHGVPSGVRSLPAIWGTPVSAQPGRGGACLLYTSFITAVLPWYSVVLP